MTIETLQGSVQGLKLAKKLLYKNVDRKTVLFLSGGSTPKLLYQDLAKEKKLEVGAVAMVDDRNGPFFHPNSNEKMIRDTGLINYLKSKKIPFYGILQQDRHSGLSRIALSYGDSGVASLPRMTQEVRDYEKIVRSLFLNFKKKVAILGIGKDGHIAGLPAKSQISSIRQAQDDPEFIEGSNLKSQNYVIGINDFPGELKERITLTFKALSQMDMLIVLVFESAKQTALNLMLTKGLEEEIPARFFNRPDIAKKTILITDQKVYNNY